MTSQYNEQALEALIEKYLTGHTTEEIKVNALHKLQEWDDRYLTGSKYLLGAPADFDKKYALDTLRFWDFFEQTQAKELEKLKTSSDWQLKILERFDRKVKKDGILRLLKKG